MTNSTKYFSLTRTKNSYYINDRMRINWKEIVLFPIPFFILLFFFVGPLVALVVSIFVTILYILFRFSAWYYYTEIHIDKSIREMTIVKKSFNSTYKTEILTKDFKFENIEYKEITSGGKTKFALIYKTHKENVLFILRNKKEKDIIEEFLEK